VGSTVKKFLILIYLFITSTQIGAQAMECYDKDRWATQITLTTMKNEELLDLSNISSIKTDLLQLQKVGSILSTKEIIYRQIQSIDIETVTKQSFKLLTISDVSDEECSMNAPTIILIYPKLKVLKFGNSYLEESFLAKEKTQNNK
jgi:hypothetical protein